MQNDPKERIRDKCPGCQFWGKGHVIDVVTKKDVCTGKFIAAADLEQVSKDIQASDQARVLPWRDCVALYQPKGPKKLLNILFGRRKAQRYCIVCGRKIKPDTFGTFCSIDCATKFMDEEEAKEKEE